jgi:proline dehydrogenase
MALKSRLAERLAARYIAGPELADALRECGRAAAAGDGSTIGMWSGPDARPDAVHAAGREALAGIAASGLDCYLSVKALALGFDHGRVADLLDQAAARGIRLHFDTLEPETAASTWNLIERASGRYANIGCTLPARWRRSLDDVRRVRDWGLPVRVVKGEWPDGTQSEANPRAAFLALVDRLQGHVAEVAVATHDPALASDALARLAASGTHRRLEQLFGLPLQTVAVARRLGVGVRVYIGYGRAWLPYRFSDGLRRSEVWGWFWRDLRAAWRRAPACSIEESEPVDQHARSRGGGR